jgi:hypothetical protein
MKVWRMRQRLQVLILPFGLIFLTGCNKIINWGQQNFEQAKVYSQKFISAGRAYVRSTIVYSQFTTVATFDAIFLTDEMRMIYVDYHKQCHGLSEEQESLMRQRMINENKYFISFYVIAAQKEHLYETDKSLFNGIYQKQTEILGSKDASWNASMIVGNKEYLPESIRVVELPMEYRNCFGHRVNQFSTTYLVRFAVANPQDRLILQPGKKHNVALKFTSPLYQVDLKWRHILYSSN